TDIFHNLWISLFKTTLQLSSIFGFSTPNNAMAIQFGLITEADLNAHLNRKKTDNEILDEAMLKRFGITHIDVFPTEPYKRTPFHAKRIRKQRKLEQEATFNSEHIVSTIDSSYMKEIKLDTSGCNTSVLTTKARATSVKQASMKPKRTLKLTPEKVTNLIHDVCKIVFKRGIVVTFIGSGKQALKTQRHCTPRFSCMKLETQHSTGKIRNVDVHIPHTLRGLISSTACKLWKGRKIHERDIKRGDSGSIIPRTELLGYAYSQFADIFIVRGRDQTLLLDSQSYVATKYMNTITHYSTSEQYWKGYDQAFRNARVNQIIHETPEKFNVSDCGAVDAILHQYIAKEGYCYMNIFLAMLVNVDEQDAKDFTKWVRDITAEQLGQWPQISDLALACHQLTILFPSTRSAELPRILVDHKTKTMHVIDSYGSLTTNYHVLKANTVSQLIAIASDTLESELKHYRVG
nr:HC-pro [Iris mild mosaic virus]